MRGLKPCPSEGPPRYGIMVGLCVLLHTSRVITFSSMSKPSVVARVAALQQLAGGSWLVCRPSFFTSKLVSIRADHGVASILKGRWCWASGGLGSRAKALSLLTKLNCVAVVHAGLSVARLEPCNKITLDTLCWATMGNPLQGTRSQ